MVFQQFNLFPHLSIVDNCALAPIWVKKIPKKQAEESALKQLEKVQILDQARKISWTIVWRTTAKSCDCTRIMYGTKNYAFRRTNIGPGSRNDQRSFGRNG